MLSVPLVEHDFDVNFCVIKCCSLTTSLQNVFSKSSNCSLLIEIQKQIRQIRVKVLTETKPDFICLTETRIKTLYQFYSTFSHNTPPNYTFPPQPTINSYIHVTRNRVGPWKI